MLVSTCRELLSQMSDGLPAYQLGLADAPRADSDGLLEVEHVLDVRVDDATGEVTIHTEPDHGASAFVAEPVKASVLIAAVRSPASPSAEIFWVGGLRPVPPEADGDDYSFRLAIPIVALAVSEDDRALVVLRSAEPDDRAALERWRDGP